MKRSTLVGISIFVIILLSGLGVGLYFLLRSNDDNTSKGAVATGTVECSNIAVEIMQKGGSAVDSAVAACLCQGLTVPQSSGLGGGFVATVYIRATETFETLNSREVAPLAAYKDMFLDDLSSREGGLAIAVPTELKGLFELHKKYGKLKWADVVQPVIEVAENGYKVTHYLAAIFEDRGDKIRSKPLFKELFTDPKTGEFYKEDDVITNQKLANTLKVIARDGSDAFYNGQFTNQIVDEIQKEGGIITTEDLKSYQPMWGKPIESKLFNGDSFHSFPLPTTGHVLNFIINILNGYGFQNHTMEYHNEDKLMYHRIIEAFKFGFAKRTKLGDESSEGVLKTLAELESVEYADSIRRIINDEKTFNDYEHYGTNASVSLDHGTGHISILAPNGDAVSITSTINVIMGSYVMSESTGMIYNNEMNDFSIPIASSDGLLPAPANYIKPFKSPISSMSPIIVLDDKKDVKLVIGGAGGILIMTSVIQVLIYSLYLNQSLETSLAMKRLHHQLQPMAIRNEKDFDPEIIKFLQAQGHSTYETTPSISGFASVAAICKRNGEIEAALDPRRGGTGIVFKIIL